jgi:hypothetical protein
MRDSALETSHSRLLTTFPSFLSTVSIVGDDQNKTIQAFRHAERKSPPVYDPARDLFIRLIQGDFTFEAALDQARLLTDKIERKCATNVLEAAKSFLTSAPPAKLGPLPPMAIRLPNGMELSVSSVWIRHVHPDRLMVLHLWEKSLSDWQLSAAGAILRMALYRHQPTCARLELDFISVAVPGHSSERRLQNYSWELLKPLDEDGLQRFFKRLCDAWTEYQRQGPREYKKRRPPDLLPH